MVAEAVMPARAGGICAVEGAQAYTPVGERCQARLGAPARYSAGAGGRHAVAVVVTYEMPVSFHTRSVQPTSHEPSTAPMPA